MERAEKWELLMKESILRGVIEVLTAEGSGGLTMKRVAEEAGVSKATLYAYFDGKAELLEAAVQASLEPLRDAVDVVLRSEADPETKLRRMMETHLGFFDQHRDTFRILLFEREKVLGKWARYRASRYRSYVDSVAGVIEDGIETGQFRPCPASKVAMMLIESIVSLNHQRLFGDEAAPLQDDVEMVIDLFLDGLRNETH